MTDDRSNRLSSTAIGDNDFADNHFTVNHQHEGIRSLRNGDSSRLTQLKIRFLAPETWHHGNVAQNQRKASPRLSCGNGVSVSIAERTPDLFM
jgi:hypothetical protein